VTASHEALDHAIATGRVPGVAAAVVADRAVQTVIVGGVADVTTQRAVEPSTAYLWFSMTKIVTATATMRLVDEGRLSLEDDVAALVPGILPESSTTQARVRVRHLLEHSAGIPNPPPIRWVRPAAQPPPDSSGFLRRRFARVKRLRFEPGSRAAYTNLGYLLLGEVVAAAAGRPFTEYVQDEVLAPLGMHATSFAFPDGRARVATGHQRLPRGLGPLLALALPRGIVGAREGPWVTFRPFLVDGAPYGGLVGPVSDAARLVLAHANRGTLGGTTVLSEDSVRAMQTIAVEGKPFDHGLGWFRPPKERDRAPAFVEHYGGGGGYHNLMRLYPDRGLGVVVMGNSTSYDVDTVVDDLARRWF
jgi:CubicO group peptidase (beta-lactamase class C family)